VWFIDRFAAAGDRQDGVVPVGDRVDVDSGAGHACVAM
jgi:hypothetical protein